MATGEHNYFSHNQVASMLVMQSLLRSGVCENNPSTDALHVTDREVTLSLHSQNVFIHNLRQYMQRVGLIFEICSMYLFNPTHTSCNMYASPYTLTDTNQQSNISYNTESQPVLRLNAWAD